MERAQSVIEEARQRLQQLLDEYQVVEAELRRLEDAEFRVCIFGSARISDQHPTYRDVYRLARSLAKLGVGIVTGGGPGLMEAANRGVRDARNDASKSYGLPIDLPALAEVPNGHLDIKSQHKRFSSRLDEFMRLSNAVIVAPGGIGTLLELMYVWQLLQVGMLERRPVILLGKEFWDGLLDWMKTQMLAKAYIGAHDFESVQVVDSPKEAVTVIRAELAKFHERRRALAVAAETIADAAATTADAAKTTAPTPEPLPWSVTAEVLSERSVELSPSPSANGRKRRVRLPLRPATAPHPAP
jgi:uncharacterized protein (TIGR00730 family)